MQRLTTSLGFGAFLAAALLAACGGGGGNSQPSSLPSALTGSASAPVTSQSDSTLTLTINRRPSGAKVKGTARKNAGKRAPQYTSQGANGLQVVVSTTGSGAATKTIYADISPTSPLCTTQSVSGTFGSHNVQTCTLTVPTLGSNEQIVATEVDTTPTSASAGYGNGFPTPSNILAVGTATPTIALGGKLTITMGLGPVANAGYGSSPGWYDCFGFRPEPTPTFAPSNFDMASPGGFGPGRIVVTGGVASEGVIQPGYADASDSCFNADPTIRGSQSPPPYVDVNGSPTPITVTAATAGITFAPLINNGTPPPAGAFVATASIPNDDYYWDNCFFVVAVKFAAGVTGTSTTITVNNNLTALNPFLSPASAYPSTLVYPVALLTASAVSGPVTVTGNISATITGTDYQATNGMGAESSPGAQDGICKSGGGATLANFTPGTMNTTTWQQPITISPMAAGTCTFDLYDADTGVPTQTVSLTVGS